MRADHHEAVFFFGKKGLAKEMLYTEFEAVLDGVVGIPEFSGQQVQSAYLTINDALDVVACVLFIIEFDDHGYADRDWNIPLRHLAENAGSGPDLGRGPIRLACRSQCSVAWYQRELWEPTARDGMNHFTAIKEAVKRNRLGVLPKESKPRNPAPEIPTITNEDDFPVLDEKVWAAPPEQAQSFKSQLEARDKLFREQLASLINQNKQQLVAAEERRKQEIEQIKRVMRNEAQVHKNDGITVQQQLAQQTVIYESLKEKFDALTEAHTKLTASYELEHEKLIQLKEEYKEVLQNQSMSKNVESEEVSELRKRMYELQCQVDDAKQVEATLEQQIKELEENGSDNNVGLDKFVDDLNQLDLVFVAYHFGAGHISLPAKMLREYLEDPDLFAAQKCNVSVEQYRNWLEHYETQSCRECGVPVKRIENPSDFVDGHHNFCTRHKKLAGNVEPLRRSV